MTTYFVRKDGNDTTGNGSTGTPWASIAKALATISAAGGHTVKVGAGTYNEFVGGLAYLYVTAAFADWVTIEPEVAGASVIVQGNGHTSYTLRFSGATYINFKNLTISDDVEKDNATVFWGDVVAGNNITFTGCTITGTKTANGKWLVFASISGTNNLNTITFTGCTLNQGDARQTIGVSLRRTAATATLNAVTLTNCNITTQGVGFLARGVTNLTVSGGSFQTSIAGGIALQVGDDAATGGIATTGIITGAYAQSALSHGVLVGNGAAAFTVSACTIVGGDFGLIIKENTGAIATNNNISGGSTSALRFKAAVGVTATGNTVSNSAANCVSATAGDTGNKCGTITFTQNKVLGTGTAALFAWGGDVADSGGCVVDYNRYRPYGTAKFGAVRGDADVQTLAELRAAWAGYGDGSNDSHSSLWVSGGGALGMGLAGRGIGRGLGRH